MACFRFLVDLCSSACFAMESKPSSSSQDEPEALWPDTDDDFEPKEPPKEEKGKSKVVCLEALLQAGLPLSHLPVMSDETLDEPPRLLGHEKESMKPMEKPVRKQVIQAMRAGQQALQKARALMPAVPREELIRRGIQNSQLQ